jgi:hypothetical protein
MMMSTRAQNFVLGALNAAGVASKYGAAFVRVCASRDEAALEVGAELTRLKRQWLDRDGFILLATGAIGSDLWDGRGYMQRRADAYPPVGDQLDALWKLVDSLLSKSVAPAEALAVRDAIAQVKLQWPRD